MFTFLAPMFLAGAISIAVPLALHLLKREPEPRVKFAPVRLLKRAPVENTEKHRLRELLLLALRVAALLLLAIAFARPFFATGAASVATGVTMVALDTSYSMSAPGRFAHAQQLARDAIAHAPTGDLVGVVTFADDATVAAKPGVDRVLATSAVNDAAPGFGATRYRAALSAAAQYLTGRHGTIVVVTDLQESGWDAGDRASVPEGTKIDLADVGPPPADLAVTAVRVQADRIVATIHNTATAARDARVHLAVDMKAAGDVTVPLGANQSGDATFVGVPRGTAASVSVDDPGGIAADDVRYAVMGGTTLPSVLIVTGSGDLGREAFYVGHALAASAAGRRTLQVAGVSGAALSSWTDAQLDAQAAVLLLSTRGLERRGRELLASYAARGGGILIAAGPEIDGDVVADVLGSSSSLKVVTVDGTKPAARTLAPADLRHPVFEPFAGNAASLGLVTFQNAARISGAACQTLARFTTGDNALIECPAGEGRALVLASDLEHRWNDFPLHATFVPFVHEVVRYLASARAHAAEYLVGDVPAGVKAAPGVVTMADAGGATALARRVVVNVDPREAEPARVSADEFQSAVTRLKDAGASDTRVEAREQEDSQHLWQYALAAMALLLATEGVVASRTV
jgi:Aerotolerance regulator N-terminal/von Willebrand factor type A domain